MHLRTTLATIVASVLTLIAASGQMLQWTATYDGPAHSFDQATSIAVDGSGNVYVAGELTGIGTGYDFTTIKYDANGNQLWIQQFDGPGHASDVARGIAVDGSGNAFVTGESTGSGTGFDYCTIKYDTNGNRVWVRRYDGPAHGDDYAKAIALDTNGNVYVTGCSDGGSASAYDYYTIKYDTNGNQVWAQRYDGPANDYDEAQAIAVDATGNAYVTGYSIGSGTGYDYCTIKYGTDGSQLWVRRFDGPAHGSDLANAIALDRNGNAYVTGRSDGGVATSYDYCTIKYDTNGNQQWVQRYDGPANDWDQANAIAVDGAGSAYVTGYSTGIGTGWDICTVKYDTLGNQVWVQRYDAPGHGDDQADAIAVDGSGNAYVVGYSANDFITIGYSSAGNQMWVQPYDGGYAANAIAVDAIGNVYGTGLNYTALGDFDWITVMYTRSTTTVFGNVDLDLYVGGDGIVGTLEYRSPGTTQPIYSSQIMLDAYGDYQDSTAPLGMFDLACKFPNWLRQVVPSVTIGASGGIIDFSLANGDADGSNLVDLFDLSTVLSNFGLVGTPPIDGDVTWDGSVDLLDLSAILSTFGRHGDP